MINDAEKLAKEGKPHLHRGAGRPVRGPHGVVQLDGGVGRRTDSHLQQPSRPRIMHRAIIARRLTRAVALIPNGVVAVVAAYSWELGWSLNSGWIPKLSRADRRPA